MYLKVGLVPSGCKLKQEPHNGANRSVMTTRTLDTMAARSAASRQAKRLTLPLRRIIGIGAISGLGLYLTFSLAWLFVENPGTIPEVYRWWIRPMWGTCPFGTIGFYTWFVGTKVVVAYAITSLFRCATLLTGHAMRTYWFLDGWCRPLLHLFV